MFETADFVVDIVPKRFQPLKYRTFLNPIAGSEYFDASFSPGRFVREQFREYETFIVYPYDIRRATFTPGTKGRKTNTVAMDELHFVAD